MNHVQAAPHGPPSLVVGAMLRRPTVLPSTATVEQARQLLTGGHQHMVVITRSGQFGQHLLGTLVLEDLPPPTEAGERQDSGGRALVHARTHRRTCGPELPLETARRELVATGRRRLAVVDARGNLCGLLCLTSRGDGFCTDAGVAARRHDRIGAPKAR